MIVRILRMREDRLKSARSLAQLCRLVLRAFGVGRELFESERPSSREFSRKATRIKESLFFRHAFPTNFWHTLRAEESADVKTVHVHAKLQKHELVSPRFSGHLMIIILTCAIEKRTSFQKYLSRMTVPMIDIANCLHIDTHIREFSRIHVHAQS